MNTTPLETSTRVLIDRTLENLGWRFNGKDQNIFLEQPKTEIEKRLLKGKRPDYVLYSKDSDNPLIIIEAKRPGERIDRALEQGIDYAKTLNAPLVFATDGVFCKSYHTFANRTPILNGEEVDEFIREALALKYLTGYEVNTVSPKVQYDRKELISIFDEANNMLRGVGLRAGIERFGEFANILFLKLISESENHKRDCGMPTSFDPACSWDSIKNISPSARIDYINTTVYKRLNNLYDTEIFTNLTMQDDSILKEIMDKLDPLMLTDVDSDVKGDAFEYFLKASASSKNDLGEYFTPRHIVKTMVRLVNPQIGEKVYDPFCGTGGFLIESFRHIYNNMARTESNIKLLKESTVYGNEITNTARITKMNMILAGDGHSNINMMDSLANPIDGNNSYIDKDGIRHQKGYDVVLANMPYSQKTKHGNLYPLSSTNGDSICVQHCMKAIKSTADNGRMALVVPEGFLFRKDLTKTREYLLENCQLQSIISLPQGVFLPYTGVKTNIIYATKVNQKVKSSERKKNFWYFDVKSDGYTLDNHRRKLDRPSDLVNYEEFRKLDEDQINNMLKVGFEAIPLDKVRANSNILVGSRYRTIDYTLNSKYDCVKLSDVSSFVRGITYPKNAQKAGYSPDYLGVVTTKAAQSDGIDKNNIVYIDKSYSKDDKLLKKDDILISLANSLPLLGRVTMVSEDINMMSFGAFMGLIRVNKTKLNPKYLFYILQSEQAKGFFTLKAKTTTNISNLTFDDLGEFLLPLPSLEKQMEIISELGGYQKIIKGAKIVVENYRPEIFINEKWERFKLNEVCDVRDGTHDSPKYISKGYPLITSKNIKNGTIDFDNVNYIGECDYKDIAKRSKVDVGDIIMPMIGTIGNPVIVDTDKLFAIKNVALIKFNNSKVLNRYIQLILMSNDFTQYVNRTKRGNTQKFISLSDIREYEVPIPSLEIQQQIVDKVQLEKALIIPSKQLIEVFTNKIKDRISQVWSGSDD